MNFGAHFAIICLATLPEDCQAMAATPMHAASSNAVKARTADLPIDPRMLETEGCAPVIAQRVNQHTQPYRPRADDPDRFRPDDRLKFGRGFSYLLHGAACRVARFLSRG